MLISLAQRDGSLPHGRRELYEKAVVVLARETEDRVDWGTPAADVPALLDTAERLACFTLLSGTDIVALDDSTGAVRTSDLASLPAGREEALIRALARSALIDSSEHRHLRFAHRQIAEYLAGRRIASLPLHQAKAFLSSGLGWRSGVAGPFRDPRPLRR